MLRHVVLFRMKEDVGPDRRAEALRELRGLAASVPEIRALRAGENEGSNPANYDIALEVDFDDMAAFERYRDSDEHQRVWTKVLQPMVADRAGVQYRPAQGG
jgi:hypothetical protein